MRIQKNGQSLKAPQHVSRPCGLVTVNTKLNLKGTCPKLLHVQKGNPNTEGPSAKDCSRKGVPHTGASTGHKDAQSLQRLARWPAIPMASNAGCCGAFPPQAAYKLQCAQQLSQGHRLL